MCRRARGTTVVKRREGRRGGGSWGDQKTGGTCVRGGRLFNLVIAHFAGGVVVTKASVFPCTGGQGPKVDKPNTMQRNPSRTTPDEEAGRGHQERGGGRGYP